DEGAACSAEALRRLDHRRRRLVTSPRAAAEARAAALVEHWQEMSAALLPRSGRRDSNPRHLAWEGGRAFPWVALVPRNGLERRVGAPSAPPRSPASRDTDVTRTCHGAPGLHAVQLASLKAWSRAQPSRRRSRASSGSSKRSPRSWASTGDGSGS